MELSANDLLHKQKTIGGKIARLMDNFKKSVAQTKITISDVETRLELLEDYWVKFQQNHDVLMYGHKAATKDSEYEKSGMAESVEETYLIQKSRLFELANQLRKSSEKATEPNPDEGDSKSGSSSLPRLPLPQFNGEYVEWPSFKDRFVSMIEQKKGMSDVDKLHYLKGALRDQAADLVKDLPTTNGNYRKAWDILLEHFENKRILVRSCLDKLAALPRMRESTVREMTQIQKGVSTVINTLDGLGRPVDQTADWFVHSIVNLFDPTTREKWEESVTVSSEPPSCATLKDFMIKRLQMMQASPSSASSGSSHSRPSKFQSSQGVSKAKPAASVARVNHARKGQQIVCVICSKDHYLMHCSSYKESSAEERKSTVEKHQLCRNCLGKHTTESCPSKKGCYTCGERHHTTLHDACKGVSTAGRAIHHAQSCCNKDGEVMLATALVNVTDRFGRRQVARALIDSGSEITMINEGLAQRLQLPRAEAKVDLYGVGGQQLARSRGRVTLNVSACQTEDTITVSAVILAKLSTYSHTRTTAQPEWAHLRGLQLADPVPGSRAPIEVLLGADVYPAIIKEGLRRGAPNQPVAQLTMFGWIVTGMTGSASSPVQAQVHQASIGDSLSSLVRRFWEQEDVQDTASAWTAEEEECEQHFKTSHSRTPEGRYQVRLPFKTNVKVTSGSRTAAWHSLRRMELQFRKDKEFKEQYDDFLKQYSELGHMSLTEETGKGQQCHYLPHHGVLRPSSSTTKLRVVFNGSWSEPSQCSLNDALHAGPNLLPPLADVILRWRKHQYVVTADVTKMYRQILVHPEDRDVQRILWRRAESERVREYRLNTVTYGLSCAPYLAVRTLRQLAEDEGSHYPNGAIAIKRDTYVDDILTGADTVEELMETANQLQQLCMAGGFPLQKWASNVVDLPQDSSRRFQVFAGHSESTTTQSSPHHNQLEEQKTWSDCIHTALGLHWSPREDNFRYSLAEVTAQSPTKRSIVSKTAQLFDPLGWLVPVIVRAKIAIQSTWLLGLDWDDPLPASMAEDWALFCAELKLLERVRVPRPLSHCPHPTLRELHGFADASERAYAAVIYLRTKSEDGHWEVALVTAKSKVAPLKQVSQHTQAHRYTCGQTRQSLWGGYEHIQAGGKPMSRTEWQTFSVEFPRHNGIM
ncbi:uncharacterized protein LOC143363357 [Halictus rubicundus]|uniref:uncharacterized protein LOC143363357 n=1 Tax=Halictus rubicundus TaxID=77578 RepID=UPI004036682E